MHVAKELGAGICTKMRFRQGRLDTWRKPEFVDSCGCI